MTTLGFFGSLQACSRSSETRSSHDVAVVTPQQAIVEDAASAFTRMSDNPRFAAMHDYIRRSSAVMIFPHVVKASVIFGGEGGNGVMVTRAPDGTWSDPAFYSLGAPSVGLQIGYQEATVVAFIMDSATLERALDSNVTFGASAGAAIGYVGNDASNEKTTTPAVYVMVESGGAYAGVSLDGYVIGPRAKHNRSYYGVETSPHDILMERHVQKPEACVLQNALARATAGNS